MEPVDLALQVPVTLVSHPSLTDCDEAIARMMSEYSQEGVEVEDAVPSGGWRRPPPSAPPLHRASFQSDLDFWEMQPAVPRQRRRQQEAESLQQQRHAQPPQQLQQQSPQQQLQQQSPPLLPLLLLPGQEPRPGGVEQEQEMKARQEGHEGQPAGGNAAAAAAAAVDEEHPQQDRQQQEQMDEELARAVYEEELRQLSGEERARLARLPGLLSETPSARSLSEALERTPGAAFQKLVPQVNSQLKGAATEPAGAGRARLLERLRQYGLAERVVKGDGACQFRSLSDQLYRTPNLHAFVRDCVVQQLRRHPELYSEFVPESYSTYCSSMAKGTTWGDHVTLQAAADHFGLRIVVLTSYPDKPFLEIQPHEPRGGARVLWLSFWAEVHYNSLYARGEEPPPVPVEKLLGSRRLHNLLLGGPGVLLSTAGW